MFIANSKNISQLELLSSMRKKYDKSLEIDAGRRAEIVKKIKREEFGMDVNAEMTLVDGSVFVQDVVVHFLDVWVVPVKGLGGAASVCARF
ncbi:hypothetical protein TrLO_g5808 [Triparma laevis f. longispina]|uniref:Uncharacterized protein n=1 Tax=Triparma laevis f. longispina TaxID=1714387 RepID=A0A9W6ZR87_9STRA|nr:hypothetical protein TrLO_g5808 [Triparma laevis f. longispina]